MLYKVLRETKNIAYVLDQQMLKGGASFRVSIGFLMNKYTIERCRLQTLQKDVHHRSTVPISLINLQEERLTPF